jgi:hypothetical protein
MAKRFTDTAKWKKEFIKGLSAKHKLLWFYILDDCDHAGIWEVDFEVASLRIGEDLSYQESFEAVGSQIEVIGKNRWWIRDFVSFQYGTLTEKNKMHAPVMAVLNKYNLSLKKEDISPINGVKVKVQVKEEVKVEEKDKGVQGGIEPDFKYELKKVEEKISELEEALVFALDEIYIDQERGKWGHIDFDFELRTFREKVRGSPDHYRGRDSGGIRLAFQSQLRHAKKKQNDRTANKRSSDAVIPGGAAFGTFD